jgi:hypothetical protein
MIEFARDRGDPVIVAFDQFLAPPPSGQPIFFGY